MPDTLSEGASGSSRHGVQVHVLDASNSREINAAFGTFGRERPDALLVGPTRFSPAAACSSSYLAARQAIPAIYGA